jgi:conjugative relaxase-like TrwC/TraI family protein
MLTIRAMSNGEGYAAKHLAHSDYYAEGERVVGQWFGRGAALLGLAGEVEYQDFEALRQGLDPHTGEFLRQRHGADRVAADGSFQSRERSLYDFTFSAPKSASLLAQLTDDRRLVKAHQCAVSEALSELESHAAARVRGAGANHDRTTGNVVLAVYHHDTSRELDPQLHTHAVAANLTFDGAENRWKALQASPIYERCAYLTEVYRNSLARQSWDLGYEIESATNSKGRVLGFEISGVSPRLIEKYSQRSQQRDQAIAEFIATRGRKPTDNEVAILVCKSRADKLTEISTPEVKARQQARLQPAEATTLAALQTAAAANPQNRHRLESAVPSLHYAEDHIFERISVARDHQLLAEALRHGRGSLNLSELKARLAAQESSGHILRASSDVGTRDQLYRENAMVAAINAGLNRFPALNDHFVASAELQESPQRTHAVQFILNSHDWAVNLRGAPGTGKTFALQEIDRGVREAGGRVLAVAPSRTGVEELQKVGFRDAITIERLLQDPNAQRSLHGRVLIVDEAGMVSGRQMLALLQTAQEKSARIIFSGDTKQIQSVEASDALRILEKESRLQSTSLTKVKRQTNLEYRQAVEELRRNPARGFEKLDEIGAIHEVAFDERPAAVVQAYAAASHHINRQGQPSSVLVVAPTHEEISSVTEAIRAHRKNAGELQNSITTDHYVSLQFTLAQKSHSHNYRLGQVLIFHRATKNAARHQAFEVVSASDGKIITRSENGAGEEFSTRQVKSFDVFERRPIEIAPGDRLLITANRKDRSFRVTNGEIVSVSGLDRKGRIQLEDGRTLPSDFRQFTHGYAVTAHRSQGKTVDAVVISADSIHKELFQVAATRGREQIRIVTGNKEGLKQSIRVSDERQSVTELVARMHPRNVHPVNRPVPALSAREEALSTPAQSLTPEPETYYLTDHRLGLPQQPHKGVDHGIHR